MFHQVKNYSLMRGFLNPMYVLQGYSLNQTFLPVF
jgi:hypothetical protein